MQDVDPKGLLAGVSHVFTLPDRRSAEKLGSDFDVYIRDNIQATQRLLEALARVPIQKYVYSSSSSVYGNHVSIPMIEDAICSRYRPYGVYEAGRRTSGQSLFANHGVPTVFAAVFHRVRTASRRTWRFSAS